MTDQPDRRDSLGRRIRDSRPVYSPAQQAEAVVLSELSSKPAAAAATGASPRAIQRWRQDARDESPGSHVELRAFVSQKSLEVSAEALYGALLGFTAISRRFLELVQNPQPLKPSELRDLAVASGILTDKGREAMRLGAERFGASQPPILDYSPPADSAESRDSPA